MNTNKQIPPIESIPETPVHLTQEDTTLPASADTISQLPCNVPPKRPWVSWYLAFRDILPVYIATHIAFFALTYLATLFIVGNFSPEALKGPALLLFWNRWDTGQFTYIATYGYDAVWRTAFFPLFPALESIPMLLTHQPRPFLAGLIVANLADLGTLIVLYRLVQKDFDSERAYRTILYLSVFPTAFFLVAAYNESFFLCLTVLSFYHIRQGRWWLAGLFGFLASLTRSAGVILLVPFCYEYLRQHNFNLKAFRLNSISSLCILAGPALFATYCFIRFHDFLAFSHAQSGWKRVLQFPWEGLSNAFTVISQRYILSFDALHNVIDASALLIMLLLVILCFVGPWRFSRSQRSYALYGASLFLFFLLFPSTDTFPLQSLSRIVLEVFPAFLILAAMGKSRQFNLYYLTFSVALLSFMLLQFLTGHWIV